MTVMKQGVERNHLSVFSSSDMSPWKNTVCMCHMFISLDIILWDLSTRMGTIEVISPYYLLSTCLVLSFTAGFVASAPERKSVANCWR
jgi:hypothetical protein